MNFSFFKRRRRQEQNKNTAALLFFYLFFFLNTVPTTVYSKNARTRIPDCRQLIPYILSDRDYLPEVHPQAFQYPHKIPKKIAVHVESVLNETDRLLSFLKRPENIIVHLHKYGGKSVLTKIGDKYVLAANYLGDGSHKKHPVHAQPVWIHEYTHSYFFDNFRKVGIEELLIRTSKEYKKLHGEQQELGKKLDEIQLRLSKGETLQPSTLSQYDQMLQREMEIKRMKIALWQKDTDHRTYQLIYDSMAELFSDTVAGVQLGDLDSIYKSLRSANESRTNRKLLVEPRKFSSAPKKSWALEYKHNSLHPARHALYRISGNRWTTAREKQEFLKKLVQVLSSELKAWSTNRNLSNATSREVNSFLIRALEKEFLTP